MQPGSALTLTAPFLVVAAAVAWVKPSAGATILFFITAVFAACMLAFVKDLSRGGTGPAYEERRKLLGVALSQMRPFAACVDCLSLVDERQNRCRYCGSRRGLTFVLDRRHKDRVKALMTTHLH